MSNFYKGKSMSSFTLGDVTVIAAHFIQLGRPELVYIVAKHPADYLDFMTKYHEVFKGKEHKRAIGLQLDGTGKYFFLVACADCFDPPCAIVRADSDEEAIDIACDETTWFDIDPDYLEEDYKGESDDPDKQYERVHWADGGKACDLDNLCIYDAKLVGVETE